MKEEWSILCTPECELTPEEQNNLYIAIDTGTIGELQWKCPGRRSPSPLNKLKEQKPEKNIQKEPQVKNDFDFMDDVTLPTMRVRSHNTTKGSNIKKQANFAVLKKVVGTDGSKNQIVSPRSVSEDFTDFFNKTSFVPEIFESKSISKTDAKNVRSPDKKARSHLADLKSPKLQHTEKQVSKQVEQSVLTATILYDTSQQKNLKSTIIQQVVNKPTENTQFIVMSKSICEGGKEPFQVIKSPPKQKKTQTIFSPKEKEISSKLPSQQARIEIIPKKIPIKTPSPSKKTFPSKEISHPIIQTQQITIQSDQQKVVDQIVDSEPTQASKQQIVDNDLIPLHSGSLLLISKKAISTIFTPNVKNYTARLINHLLKADGLKICEPENIRSIITHVTQVFNRRGNPVTEQDVEKYVMIKLQKSIPSVKK